MRKISMEHGTQKKEKEFLKRLQRKRVKKKTAIIDDGFPTDYGWTGWGALITLFFAPVYEATHLILGGKTDC